MADQIKVGSGGGYPGGPTPSGYTPHEDGTGRFMYDADGRIHMTPAYREWLNSNDQRVDWAAVAADLARIVGSSYGGVAAGEVRRLVGFGVSALGEYFNPSLDYRDRRDDNDSLSQR